MVSGEEQPPAAAEKYSNQLWQLWKGFALIATIYRDGGLYPRNAFTGDARGENGNRRKTHDRTAGVSRVRCVQDAHGRFSLSFVQ